MRGTSPRSSTKPKNRTKFQQKVQQKPKSPSPPPPPPPLEESATFLETLMQQSLENETIPQEEEQWTETGDGKSQTRINSALGSKPSSAFVPQRRVIKGLWEICCAEVATEFGELNEILARLGLPTDNPTNKNMFELIDYEEAPHLETCLSKDFLDFWVFPILLPAIQSLIQFARMNRVFQCRSCSFNSLDYIVEYLYNNNPRYPDRIESPTPLFDIPFVKSWLAKYPRPPLPKWLTMTDEEAAKIIQRAFRGFLVRAQPHIQEMRQFWKDYKKDRDGEEEDEEYKYKKASNTLLLSPYYEELSGEYEPNQVTYSKDNHSDTCLVCSRFKQYLVDLPPPKTISAQGFNDEEELSSPNDDEGDEVNEKSGNGEDPTTPSHHKFSTAVKLTSLALKSFAIN